VSVNGGTLTYSGDGTLSAEAVGNWLGFVSKGELVVTAGLTASEVTPKAIIDAVTPKIAGKTVTLTATKAGIETETSLVIPAGLVLTADGSDDLQYVTSVRAEAGGSFTAAAGTGKSTGLAVTANGYLELGDVSKLLASSVGEGGTLVLGDGSVLDDDVAITVAAFGSVNGTVFPGATSITAIGDGEFTIGSLTVPAGAVFTVACELTVTGTLAIEGDGSVGLALAADKVILPVGGALDVKHATGSFGEATQSDTKVTVVASGNPTATPAAGTKNGTMWTVTTASSGDGTDFSSTPIILGTLKYATNNSTAAVDGTACADADTAAAAGKLVAGTGTTITFAGDGE
jgi:hypothetical protein